MSRHLSEEELAAWLEQQRSAASGRHLEECPACRYTVGELDETLALFGETAREWAADRESERMAHRQSAEAGRTHTGPARLQWLWSMAAALLLLVLAVPVCQHELAAHARKTRQLQLARDSALMQAVDDDVSQVVPEALAPLDASSTSNEVTGN